MGPTSAPARTPGGAKEERAGVTFGPALRHAREAQGLTLREMTQRTAIRRDYLQALEDEHLDGLPEPTFARAYLRTYTRELGLDPTPLLADFDRLLRPGVPEPQVSVPAEPPQEDTPSLGPVRIALIAVLLALLLAVGVLLLRRPVPAEVTPAAPVPVPTTPAPVQPPAAAPVQPPVPPPASPQGTMLQDTVLQGTVRLTIKSVPDGAVVYLDNRNLGRAPVLSFPVDARRRAELRVEAPGRVPLKQTIHLGQSRHLRATLPPAGGEASVLTDLNTGVRTLTPLPAPPPTPAAPPSSAVPSPFIRNEIVVRLVGPSWVRVSDSGGGVLYEGMTPAGGVLRYPPGVTVRAGNAGALRVSVGGGPEQAMGEAGQVVTRRF